MQNRANFDDFEITEEEAKKFIRLSLEGKLKFAVMNHQTGQYQELNERQLNVIYVNHPNEKEIRLKEALYNGPTLIDFSYEQSMNYKHLWFDRSIFSALLDEYPHYSKKLVTLKPEISLQMNPYWQNLTKLTIQAIKQYPKWKEDQKKVQITGNLMSWIKETITPNNREADVIKKTLLSHFEK